MALLRGNYKAMPGKTNEQNLLVRVVFIRKMPAQGWAGIIKYKYSDAGGAVHRGIRNSSVQWTDVL
jgi:hypothetical protein